MLKELALKLRGLKVEPVPFDPSTLGDPVAARTEWGPAKGGGIKFRTHRLAEAAASRMEFRATRRALLFHGVFIAIGLAIAVGSVVGSAVTQTEGLETLAVIVSISLGLLFIGGGCSMLYSGTTPVVFDKRRGDYWKGRVAPYETGSRLELEEHAKLDRIYALQLISERCRSRSSSYDSYELNLVLDDGARMNVIDHADLEQMRRDAEVLAAFLGRPVWDATGVRGRTSA